MPELPEVETIVRRFRPLVVGRRIADFTATSPGQVLPNLPRVRAHLRSRRIDALERRGKYIIFSLEDHATLLVHLRMSGRFEWAAELPEEPPHLRAVWSFQDNNRLYFCDARKFGRIIHTREPDTCLAPLGVEPLGPEFSARWLADALQSRKRLLKPLLLDQTFIAGLGNIYADEALFSAKLHPLRSAHSLTPREVVALHRAIRHVLRKSIRYDGTTLDWIYPRGRMQEHLKAYGRKGQPCPRCRTEITLLRVAQRSTHICPNCQQPPPSATENPARSHP